VQQVAAGQATDVEQAAAPAPVPATAPAAGPDPAAVRQFVLQSLTDGQPRDAVEAYLRESLGVTDPAGFVNEALAQQG